MDKGGEILESKEKKVIIAFLIIWIIVIIGLSMLVAYKTQEQYKQYMYDYTNQVIEKVHNEYSDAEEEIVKLIINNDYENLQNDTLKKYGIDKEFIGWSEKGSALENQLIKKELVILIIGFLVIIIAIVLYPFSLYLLKIDLIKQICSLSLL